MDVIILVLVTAAFGGWLAWVSGRGETRHSAQGRPKDG